MLAVQVRRRRGTMYLIALASSTLVVVVGLGALLTVRIYGRDSGTRDDFATARYCARSGIELAMLWIEQYPNWRTLAGDAGWTAAVAVGDGSFTLNASDPNDGDLGDSDRDSVILTSIGQCNDARFKLQVMLQPVIEPLESLSTCLHAVDDIAVESGKALYLRDAPLSANDRLTCNGYIEGDVEAGSVSGFGSISGSTVTISSLKEAPDPGVFDTYVSRATALPSLDTMERVLLTPGSNPWGAPNDDGVYYVDTNNRNLLIRYTRIHGTLVVDAGSNTVTVSDACLLQNARDDYPVLIVRGKLDIELKSDDFDLCEEWFGVNFNPAGSPYETRTDDDATDCYPNTIEGLVHATDDVKLEESSLITGTVLTDDDLTVDGRYVRINHDSSLLSNPPEGYTTVTDVIISPGTWQRTVD